jgi:hypothetical protein
MLTPVQRAVAEIIGRTVGQDFALGGGAALQIHGVVDRASRDLDA